MNFISQNIPDNHGKFILAKISTPSALDSPAVIILPDRSSTSRTIERFAETLTYHGFACCIPPNQADIQEESKSSSQNIRNPKTPWDLGKLNHVMQYMRSAPQSNGKTDVIGFGDGGQQAYLAACRLNPEAVIIYHGKAIDVYLEEGRHIDCQTVFHAGKNDPYMTTETDRKLHAALIGKFNIAIYKYDAGDALRTKMTL